MQVRGWIVGIEWRENRWRNELRNSSLDKCYSSKVRRLLRHSSSAASFFSLVLFLFNERVARLLLPLWSEGPRASCSSSHTQHVPSTLHIPVIRLEDATGASYTDVIERAKLCTAHFVGYSALRTLFISDSFLFFSYLRFYYFRSLPNVQW